MKTNKDTIGWGSTRVTYEIMTDSKGHMWRVPTSVDGQPCEYLVKHDPSQEDGTFERITITKSVKPT